MAWPKPVSYTHLDVYKRQALKAVRDKSPVAISAGERLYTLRSYKELFELRAADYIQPDVSHAGRIMELKKIAAAAEA